MSGFKQPIYEVLGLTLQSFSVYDTKYELLETKYKSPIAINAFTNYTYKLLDSTSIQNREVYVIYFKTNKSYRLIWIIVYRQGKLWGSKSGHAN